MAHNLQPTSTLRPRPCAFFTSTAVFFFFFFWGRPDMAPMLFAGHPGQGETDNGCSPGADGAGFQPTFDDIVEACCGLDKPARLRKDSIRFSRSATAPGAHRCFNIGTAASAAPAFSPAGAGLGGESHSTMGKPMQPGDWWWQRLADTTALQQWVGFAPPPLKVGVEAPPAGT